MAKPSTFRWVSPEPLRVSYPNFFQKDKLSDKYSAFFLIGKDQKAVLTSLAAKLKEAREDGAKTIWEKPIPNAPTTLEDCDKPKASTGQPWPEEYANCMILKATSAYPTQVFDEKKQPIKAGSPEASKVYGGCYMYPILDFQCYDALGRQGVKCYLAGAMFAKDGESFGGGGSIVADLPDVEIDEALADGTASNPADDLAALLG